MRIVALIGILTVSMSLAAASARAVKSADIVLRNGRIVTMDDARPEVRALAVRGDRVVWLGGEAEVAPYIGPRTRVIDLQGRLATPGWIESHGHFMGLGEARMQLDLAAVADWVEIERLVAEAARRAAPGEWILGRGWHQEKWRGAPTGGVGGLPRHDELSRLTPDNPVMLVHASGHSLIANACAMKRAGIDERTAAPAGGEIVRDDQGRAIGVFSETAMELIRRSYQGDLAALTPAQRQARDERIVETAGAECRRWGITSFHDAGVSFARIDFYRGLAARKRLPVRLYAMIEEDNAALRRAVARYRLPPSGDCFLAVRAIKRMIDGALGSHGAWLLQPYDSLPGSCGLNTENVAAMREAAAIARQNGFQLCTHAIGDRGVRETLDVYEAALRRSPPLRDARWRIEHAQHIDPADRPRFAALGIVAAMQGIHCVSDAPWVIKRLGARRAESGAYLWRTLLDDGVVVCNGTDTPVEPVDPIACFHAAVTRRLADGSQFFPAQCMTRLEALRSYTLAGAYAAFEEKIKGSLAVGKLADIAVFTRDLLTVPEAEIRQTRVALTILAGKVVYGGE